MIKVGTKIRFLRTLTGNPTGDHPAFLYAHHNTSLAISCVTCIIPSSPTFSLTLPSTNIRFIQSASLQPQLHGKRQMAHHSIFYRRNS